MIISNVAIAGLPMPNPMNWSFFTPGIVSSLEASLKRMGVESIELYQVCHTPLLLWQTRLLGG